MQQTIRVVEIILTPIVIASNLFVDCVVSIVLIIQVFKDKKYVSFDSFTIDNDKQRYISCLTIA